RRAALITLNRVSMGGLHSQQAKSGSGGDHRVTHSHSHSPVRIAREVRVRFFSSSGGPASRAPAWFALWRDVPGSRVPTVDAEDRSGGGKWKLSKPATWL